MKKRLLPLLFFLAFGIVTFAQNVTIDIQESSNGCGLSTDCENNVACFDLIITINQPNWELASYNIWSQYPKPATMSYASDNACLTQNGGDTDDNVNGQYRVAGINGVTLLQPGVPTIFHTICYDYLDAEIIRDSVIAVGGRLSVYGFPFNTTVTLSHTITGATAGLTINTQEYLNINSNTLSCLVPDLLIEKELTSYVDNDASGTISFGDVLTYTITTTNTGNITQNNVVISDPILNPASTTCVTLPVGAQCILTGTYTVSQADVNAGKIVNVATVVSDEVGPYEASITTPIGQQPEMTINKTLLTNVTGVAGQSLVYKVVVTNTGNTTLNNVAVSDLKLTPKLAFCASVLPGQTCTLTGAYLVTQADIDAGEIVNAANAISDETPPATTEITTPVPQYPSITTVKTLLTDVSGGIAVDDLLTYSVKVTNTGNITLHNVTVSDPMLTPNSKTCATLAPAGSCTHTGTYVVKQSDIDAGQIVNTGIGDSDETGSVSSQITTTIEQKPAMIVAKQLDTDISSGVMAGDVLTYTVEITNTGNITLNNVVVSDNKITPAQATCATVAPGATCSLTGTYTLTQADIDAGEIGNTGTGDSDQTDPVTKDITTPLPQTPLLTVEKSSTGITYTAIGEEIYYTITVTNTGNVTIDNIEITDANADIGSIACSGTSLLPGEFLTCMAIHTVDMDDMLAGEVVNIAKATGDDPLGNPLSFESNEVVVTVKVLIANDDIGTPVNGNDGGVAVPNVLDNDALNGNPVIPAEIILTQISTTNPGVTLNPATGAVNVAPGTPAGNYELVYEICEIALPANCDQATVFVTVEAPEILAVADNATGINGYTGQQDVLNIFDNDLLNGVAVDPEKVTLTETSPDPTGSLTLNPDGSVDVIPGTPAGTYSLTYTICEKLNPTNCSTATVQIEVIAPEILAEDDSYSPINGYDGNPNVGNALTNDSYNGIVPASIDDVDITVLTPATPVTPGANVPVLDITTGIVSVPAQTPAGTYTIEYKICDALNPTNCDPATITVVVAPAVILAVDDTGNPVNGLTGGDAGINVLDNDKLNGADVIPVEVTITSTPTTELTVNTDGTVTVAPGTPAGTYTIDYKICEVLNPTNCDDATVEVEVTAPGILANDDDYSSTPVNGYTGNPNVGNALTNDSYNGIVPASIDDVDITVLTPATPVAPGANVPALDITTGIVSVPAQTPAGTYTIEYKICDALNPTNCDPATITVVVAPAVILAVDDTGNPVNGLTGGDAGINVLDNDKLNGADVIPVEVTITSTPTTELTVNTDGTVTVAPGTPAGTYTIDYKICEVLNPTNCDDATVEVEVTAPGILANDDDYSSTPVNGYTGNPNVGNALTNDSYNGIVPASIDDVDITVLTPATPVTPGANVPALDITTGIISVPAQTPAGTYTIEYQICDALNPTLCDPATITIVVAPAVILAVDDTGAPVNGYNGGISVSNVLVNDSLNGITVNPLEVTLMQISTSNAGVTLNEATGEVTVAPGTPAGNYVLVYQICENLNPSNCDQATVFVEVTFSTIIAKDDYGTPVNGYVGDLSVLNVLENDELNGAPVILAEITLVQISSTHPGVMLDPITGNVRVAPGTPAGNYELVYRICEILNPGNCDEATVFVPVTAAEILAIDDTGNPVNGLTGGDAGINVLDNDKLNGADVIPVKVTITSTPTTELMVNTDGTVTVAPGTPAGTYTIDYKICEVLNPTNCDDATVEVEVTAPGILANDDDYSSTPVNGYTGNPNVGNALTNDSYNGIVPASIDDVDITVLTPATPVAPGANVPALDITTGIVSVPAQTPAGTYTIEYQICDALNPTNCDPATITVVVAPAVILAVDDTGTPINGYVGGVSVPTVFVNDLLNGAPFNPSQVTLTQISPAIPGISINTITGEVTVAPGTPAGNYELIYKICEVLNPLNCDQAIVYVPVTAPEILANDDNGPLINGVLGGVSVANVLANDLLNGILVNPALITLTQISTTNPGVTLDPITGAVNVAAGTSTGTYYVEYKICEILNPANCDQALVTVPVFQEPTVTFCLNSEEAQSSGLYTYCSTEPVAFTLCGIDAGVAPFDICYEINGVPDCVYDIALDDVIFSQLFAAGTYNITIISITDQAGYSVFDLSSYHFDFTISVGATAFAGIDAIICQGSTYTLSSATAQNSNSFTWSGGDGAFTPSADVLNPFYTPGPQDILAGSVPLCLTAQSELPCTLESVDCLTLTITVPPSADAGSDIIACESDGFVMLDGVVNNAASAEWNTTSTDGFFFDENEASTIYVFGADDIANGGATLCLTATAIGPCLDPATDCLVLTIIADPTANAGSNATICEGNDYTLSGASVTNAGEVMWETFGDGMFDNPSLLNPTYTPGAADIAAGTVQLCIDAEAAQNCGTTAFDCMILTIAKLPLANPGGDLSLSCNDYDIPNGKWLPVELTNTITGDYASIQWTTDGDGTFSDPTALAPLYNPGLADIWKGDIELCVTVESVEACQTSDTKCMMLYIPQQLIYFDADGWWGVSSYLDTDLPLVSQVMDPLVLIPGSQHLVTMLDKQGKYFWPEPIPTQGNLGNWIPIGYKAKIKNPPACLPIYGDSLLNQTFTVSGAFTFLPVLTNVPVAINQLLAGHLSDILLIYDWSNKVLWTPQAADFTELFPGRAYLMVNKLATGSYTIEYPDFVPNAPHLYPTTLPKSAMIHNSPWQQESNTAVPHIMLFDNKVMSKLNSGDILAVFDSQGNCYGQTEYGNAEEVFSLIAMGRNDQLRDERAGFETGEKIFMRRYNAATGVQQAVTFVYDTDFPSSDGLFAENGASRVVDFIETATNVNDDLIMNNVTIYPNPASSEINIKAAGNIRKVELLSSTGQIIMSQSFDATQIRLDVSQYKAGVYIVAITQSSGNVITRRVTIF